MDHMLVNYSDYWPFKWKVVLRKAYLLQNNEWSNHHWHAELNLGESQVPDCYLSTYWVKAAKLNEQGSMVIKS